ncbi:MAG: serine hydrolase domain-containing protein [Myxococcota bacterium]
MLLLLACAQPDDDVKTPADDTGEPTPSDDTGTAPDPWADAKDAVGRAARQDLRGAGATGASVAVWVDGEVVYAEGFGTKHPDTDEAVTTSTLFQIGSDTKKIAAIAALQQVERGALTLGSTVADVVPELVFASDPGLAGELTLHELLSHQSGLFDYTPWVEAPDDADLYDRAVGRFAENEYAPGTSGLYWSYCNPNFSLAGLLTERVDGRAWPDVVEQDVFAPLGMTRTLARRSAVEADGDHAIGYGIGLPDGYDTFDPFADLEYTYGTVEIEGTYDAGFTRPAGLVWSTATDMAILAGFLVDGDEAVLSDELLAEVTTPQVAMYPATDAADFGYGYGLMVNSFGWSGYEGYHAGVPLWAHGGNTMTMTSTFYVLPEQRVAVAILSNGYADDFTGTAVTALEAFADLPAVGTADTFLNEAGTGEALAGTWHDPNVVGTLTLTWDGERLVADAPDLDARGLDVGEAVEPYFEDLYLLTIDGYDRDLNHYRADDGSEWLVNRQFAWKRVDGNVAARMAPARTPRLLPPAPDVRRRAFGL